jgi:hypothetical protein
VQDEQDLRAGVSGESPPVVTKNLGHDMLDG